MRNEEEGVTEKRPVAERLLEYKRLNPDSLLL